METFLHEAFLFEIKFFEKQRGCNAKQIKQSSLYDGHPAQETLYVLQSLYSPPFEGRIFLPSLMVCLTFMPTNRPTIKFNKISSILNFKRSWIDSRKFKRIHSTYCRPWCKWNMRDNEKWVWVIRMRLHSLSLDTLKVERTTSGMAQLLLIDDEEDETMDIDETEWRRKLCLCHICGSVMQRNSLYVHLKAHNGYKCDFHNCSLVFTSKKKLTNHQRVHG